MCRLPRGYTLVELLTAMTVLGLMIGVGVPSFRALTASQKVKTAASKLQSFLVTTRSEALKHNDFVRFEPIVPNNWNSGWNISDRNRDVLFTAEPTPAITISGPSSVVYQGSGRLSSTAYASNPVFKISSLNTSDIRCVEIDLSGIPNVTSSGC